MEGFKIEHLSYKCNNGKVLLDDINFMIQPNDRIAILGDNGAGKTTLIETILGFNKASTGTVFFNGEKIHSVPSRDVGIVWDYVEIFPWLRVSEIVRYFMAFHKTSSLNERVYELLNIESLKNKLAKVLSRGENKKLAILLATITNPKYLFLDELSSNLDEGSLQTLWDGYLMNGKTILFSTHNWEEANRYANKYLFMSDGRILLPPMSKEDMMGILPYAYKMVINQEEFDPNRINIPYHICKDKYNIYINESDGEIIDKVSELTHNYSILPIEISDIYAYLKTNKRS